MSSGANPRTLAGRYRLEEVIGRGGMSSVYRATDLALDRKVAVKVALDPQAEENPIYVARFKREARAAAAISHPGVVTVFDAGADGPTRYIVMELVEGRSLADTLRDEGPLDPGRSARIVEQVADTLQAAHAAGIVHRDIKPGNIMVEPGDRVKVLDFGIARTADAVTLTQTASVLGTAPYMAPEQAMGNPADARSDIYSLGCVLFEMLTGETPFTADLPAAMLHQHVRVQPRAPSVLNPAVPPALDALVLQMLAKAPADRPQTAAEVRDRLAGLGTEAPTAPTSPLTAASQPLVAAAAVPQVATVPEAPTPPPKPAAVPTRALPPRRKRSAGPWTFLAVIAVLLLGAAVAYALATSGGSSTPTSSPPHTSTPPTAPASTTPPTTTPTRPTTPTTTPTTTTTTTPTTTTTTTPTTTTTTPTATNTPGTTPPGQGGTPPGQAKKGKGG